MSPPRGACLLPWARKDPPIVVALISHPREQTALFHQMTVFILYTRLPAAFWVILFAFNSEGWESCRGKLFHRSHPKFSENVIRNIPSLTNKIVDESEAERRNHFSSSETWALLVEAASYTCLCNFFLLFLFQNVSLWLISVNEHSYPFRKIRHFHIEIRGWEIR